MTTYFTSDSHWGHLNIIKYSNRPYQSVEEMNEQLILNWNARVLPGDSIYHLGDFAFMPAPDIEKVLRRLNGQKHLVYGNHDKIIKSNHHLQKYFNWCRDYHEMHISDGTKKYFVVLCHFAMLVWNKRHHGSIMLHGHSHGALEYPFKARIMDVGVDSQGYFPISENEVLEKMLKIDN